MVRGSSSSAEWFATNAEMDAYLRVNTRGKVVRQIPRLFLELSGR